MSLVSVVRSVDRTEDDLHFWAFQGLNAWNNTEITVGDVFLGITNNAAFTFRDLDIPRGSTIATASMEVVSTDTRFGSATNGLRAALADGVWDVPSFTGWRTHFWGDFVATVRDTGAATIVATVAGVGNQLYGLRDTVDRRQRLAQRFLVPAGPNPTMGSVVLR